MCRKAAGPQVEKGAGLVIARWNRITNSVPSLQCVRMGVLQVFCFIQVLQRAIQIAFVAPRIAPVVDNVQCSLTTRGKGRLLKYKSPAALFE